MAVTARTSSSSGSGPELFSDRLFDAVDRLGTPLCVGLDPTVDRLPDRVVRSAVRRKGPGREGVAYALVLHCEGVLEALADVVPVVKIQSACFELYGAPGVRSLERVIARARKLGYLVILDAKRGDIGTTARHYAAAALGRAPLLDGTDRPGLSADAMTVNAYLGPESLQPFVDTCLSFGGGLFVVAASSNPGAEAFQGRPDDPDALCRRVALTVAERGEGLVGRRGYSSMGLVVGATRPEAAPVLRRLVPHCPFLVPGVGPQGGSVDDLRPFFDREGRGALVTASRAVVCAGGSTSREGWESAIRKAAVRLSGEIRRMLDRPPARRAAPRPPRRV